jgi:lipoyl(octanoyl) transferase
MNHKIIFEDLGLSEYKKIWEYQEMLTQRVIDQKMAQKTYPKQELDNYLLFVEHPHVYTLGKSGDEQNLLLNYIQLQANDATFFHTNRGGDITCHLLSLLVSYPIFGLENFGIGMRKYIFNGGSQHQNYCRIRINRKQGRKSNRCLTYCLNFLGTKDLCHCS